MAVMAVDLDPHAVTDQIFADDSPRFIAAQISRGQLDAPPSRRGERWSACHSDQWG
jgi:hypothetical protein